MDAPRTFEQAWLALRRHLDGRAADLCAAVRRYPGPIARCDEQLTQLIADRDVAMHLAARAAVVDAPTDRDAFTHEERIACFAATFNPRDDARARALRDAVLGARQVAA